MNLKKLVATMLIASTSMTLAVQANSYAIYHSHADAVLKEELAKQRKAINNNVGKQIHKQKDTYVKNMNESTEKIVQAILVATSQEAMASVQIGTADKASKQVLVTAMQADMQSEAAVDAMMRFSPNTGQGYAACTVLAKNAQLSQVMNTVGSQASVKVDEIDTSPHALQPSFGNSFVARTELHNKNFCTDAEGERNVCEPVAADQQGADSNAASLLVSAPAGSKTALAKQAVRQNILGSPTVAIPSKVAGTAAGQAYLYAINQKSALAAFPAYSLAYLESMSEVRDDVKDADGNPQSPNDMLFNTVARYYGGKDSGEWQASMISQQPRGLLVELAKMEGLGAWMDYQEYLAMQRMEGNLAAMTLTAAIPMEQRLEKQFRRAQSAAIQDSVR